MLVEIIRLIDSDENFHNYYFLPSDTYDQLYHTFRRKGTNLLRVNLLNITYQTYKTIFFKQILLIKSKKNMYIDQNLLGKTLQIKIKHAKQKLPNQTDQP